MDMIVYASFYQQKIIATNFFTGLFPGTIKSYKNFEIFFSRTRS